MDPASGDADGGSWLLDEAPPGGAAAAVGCSDFGPAALLGGLGRGAPPSRLGAKELASLLARRGGGCRGGGPGFGGSGFGWEVVCASGRGGSRDPTASSRSASAGWGSLAALMRAGGG